jgi:hypothetical protein
MLSDLSNLLLMSYAVNSAGRQRSNQLNYVPTRQINEMRINSAYPALKQSAQVPGPPEPTLTNWGRDLEHTVLKYPNSFSENTEASHRTNGPFFGMCTRS